MKKYSEQSIWVLCICVLCGIFTIGLWPFGQHKNDVTWVGKENGLRFGEYGTVLGTSPLNMVGSDGVGHCSLEIWLQPGLINDSNQFLTFYTRERLSGFAAHQESRDLIIVRGASQASALRNFFQEDTRTFITISSGPVGTVVYRNAIVQEIFPDLTISGKDCQGSLIIGDAPLSTHSWSGQLLGLAIYRQTLTQKDAQRHYDTWLTNGEPEIERNENAKAIFLFKERYGNTVHNQIQPGPDLIIPINHFVVDQRLLQRPSWTGWKDTLINVIGFIPLGYILSACIYLKKRGKTAAAMAIIVGFCISLAIESVQSLLSTRDSTLTDVITNTCGSIAGAMLYLCRPLLLVFDHLIEAMSGGLEKLHFRLR